MSKKMALVAAAAMAAGFLGDYDSHIKERKISLYPPKPTDTDADHERIAAAQAKRERRAAKRVRS